MRNRYLRRPVTVSASVTLDSTYGELRVDATAAARTITVPLAAGFIAREFTVKKIDASVNAVTLSRSGADTIDGAATLALAAQWDSVTIKSDGVSKWDVIAKVAAGGGGGGAPTTATYVTLSNDATLTAERVLAGEASVVSLTDAGANLTVTVGIAANGITDAKLRQGAATSVVGRSAGTVGNVADITAAADDTVLRRTAGALGFGQLTVGMFPASVVTYAKIQNVSATQLVLGRNTAGAGVIEEVSASGVLDWIGSTRGSVLYRGAGGWAALTPGTAGQALTSNGAGADPSYQATGGAWTIVKKVSDEQRASNVTLTADGALTIALSAATSYRVRAVILLDTANATMDYKYDWNFSGTWTGIRWVSEDMAAGGAATVVRSGIGTLQGSTSVTATTTGEARIITDIFGVVNGAGTLAFRWAQNTSDVGNLRVQAGSYLEYSTF